MDVWGQARVGTLAILVVAAAGIAVLRVTSAGGCLPTNHRIHDRSVVASCIPPAQIVLHAGQIYLPSGSSIVKWTVSGHRLGSYDLPGPTAAVAMDGAANMYVTGSSVGRPGSVPYRRYGPGNGERGAYVAKLSPEGQVMHLTYLAGTHNDNGTAISVDSSGGVWVGGSTMRLRAGVVLADVPDIKE